MRVVLDTNVISEAMHPDGLERVRLWLEGLDKSLAAVTTITLSEIQYGLRLLPDGARRVGLENAFDHAVSELSILPFDAPAAAFCADIRADRYRRGRPVSLADAQIAGIAKHHGAMVATRDSGGFEGTGVDIFNPWAEHDGEK